MIWDMGKGKGEELTLKNALQVVKDTAFPSRSITAKVVVFVPSGGAISAPGFTCALGVARSMSIDRPRRTA